MVIPCGGGWALLRSGIEMTITRVHHLHLFLMWNMLHWKTCSFSG